MSSPPRTLLRETHEAALDGKVEDWAVVASRQAYQVPQTGKRLKPGQKLLDPYVKAIRPVLRRFRKALT
jgi:hypothetical protein